MTDDLKDKFEKDLAQARAEQQLEARDHNLVENGKTDLWNTLRKAASDAVKEIRESSVLYADNDAGGKDLGFSIIYDRVGVQLRAIATFRKTLNRVEVKITSPGKNIVPNHSYAIIASNNKVEFSQNDRVQSPQTIVETMLSNLL